MIAKLIVAAATVPLIRITCSLFNSVVSNLDDGQLNGRKIREWWIWKDVQKILSWPNLMYYTSICLQGLMKSTKNFSQDSALVQTRTGHHQNTSWKHHHLKWVAQQKHIVTCFPIFKGYCKMFIYKCSQHKQNLHCIYSLITHTC
jgi:hypothetical protein